MFFIMKITVEISEKDLKDVMRFSGVKKMGQAISAFVASELKMKRRLELSKEVSSGKFRVKLPDVYALRTRERKRDANITVRC